MYNKLLWLYATEKCNYMTVLFLNTQSTLLQIQRKDEKRHFDFSDKLLQLYCTINHFFNQQQQQNSINNKKGEIEKRDN